MAIILGSKLVQDLEENARVAIGVTLPFTRGNNGYFAQSYQTIEQIKSNIKNLLLTDLGERIMQPDFGTELRQLLFSPNTNDLEQKIQSSIENAIDYWMPFVSVEDILVQQTNDNIDKNVFSLSVTFRINNQQDLETVTFNILE